MQQSKNSILEAGAKFLSDPKIMAKMPTHIQSAIASGAKEFAYAEFYFKKRFTAIQGIIDFIKETDTLTPGERNFDKGKLPVETYMALVSISVNYAFDSNSTTGVEPSSQNFSNSEYFNTIHKQFRNSEFELKNGNKQIIKCLTKSFLADSLGGYGVDANEENGLVLPQPKLLLPESRITAIFEFPSNSVTATTNSTNNHFAEIILKGVKLVDRVEK